MATVSVEYLARRNICEPVTSVFLRIDNTRLQQNLITDDNMMAFVKGLGRMFYMVDPQETSFPSPDLVPNFYRQSWPYFLLFILLENILLWWEKKPTYRLNDGITSLSLGIIQQAGRLIWRGGESYVYMYIYNNYRLFDLEWDNVWTWYAAAIGVDFCYYWVHRACHEVHILWAQHQVHHSSEDFNMAVGVRQSIFQGWCGFLFYIPLAIAVPPSHFMTHQQFNLLYQFWIHTETVKNLGPFEWIFNTPQHHRVHHGSNLYCLDKNYGGVLIIWDRIFGTFAEEREKEQIIYGLVVNQPSFNPLHLQTFYSRYAFEKCRSMTSLKHKLAAIFWGPSWIPGRPRLGLEEDKIKVEPREKYDVKLPLWCNLYLLAHFCFVVYGFQALISTHIELGPLVVSGFVVYIIASLTVIGMFFDNNPTACVFELLRCMLLVAFLQRATLEGLDESLLLITESFFLVSSIFWFLHTLNVVQITSKTQQ